MRQWKIQIPNKTTARNKPTTCHTPKLATSKLLPPPTCAATTPDVYTESYLNAHETRCCCCARDVLNLEFAAIVLTDLARRGRFMRGEAVYLECIERSCFIASALENSEWLARVTKTSIFVCRSFVRKGASIVGQTKIVLKIINCFVK